MMNLDSELDQQLMQQFSCLGTQDKDVLVSELQKLLGNQLNPAGCAFFLDMNNWNLQAAVCAYYDLEPPQPENLPCMQLMKDLTIGEGESVPPNERFVKTWRLRNTGTERWPPGCSIVFIQGDQLGPCDRIMLEAIEADDELDVSVELISPATAGIYHGMWKMISPTGQRCGDDIWIILSVQEGGVLHITQQLQQFSGGGEFQQLPQQTPDNTFNPFASPSKTSMEEQSQPVSQSSLNPEHLDSMNIPEGSEML